MKNKWGLDGALGERAGLFLAKKRTNAFRKGIKPFLLLTVTLFFCNLIVSGKYSSSLGEAPVWRYAAAQKCPKTPMGQQESST